MESNKNGCREQDWGRLDYAVAMKRQRALAGRRAAGHCCDTIVRVAHPPTITLGRHAPLDDLLLDSKQLQSRGISLQRSDRGGRATWHGPGQAVVYPVVSLSDLEIGVAAWVCLLESAVIEVLQGYGVDAERRDGSPGIWTQRGKIASLGLRVSRGVSYHGVALNVGLDVSGFEVIVTCGVEGERVTSLEAHGASALETAVVSRQLSAAVATRLHGSAAYEKE